MCTLSVLQEHLLKDQFIENYFLPDLVVDPTPESALESTVDLDMTLEIAESLRRLCRVGCDFIMLQAPYKFTFFTKYDMVVN